MFWYILKRIAFEIYTIRKQQFYIMIVKRQKEKGHWDLMEQTAMKLLGSSSETVNRWDHVNLLPSTDKENKTWRLDCYPITQARTAKCWIVVLGMNISIKAIESEFIGQFLSDGSDNIWNASGFLKVYQKWKAAASPSQQILRFLWAVGIEHNTTIFHVFDSSQ